MVTFPVPANSDTIAATIGPDPQNTELRVTAISERLFQLLFWSAITIAFVMASLPEPPALPGNPSDKQLHMLAFLALATLATFAFPRARILRLFLVLAAFGAVLEIIQAIPAVGREASLLDWLADLVATGAALILAGTTRAALRYVQTNDNDKNS